MYPQGTPIKYFKLYKNINIAQGSNYRSIYTRPNFYFSSVIKSLIQPKASKLQ